MDDAKYPAFDTKPYRIVKSRSEASVPVNVAPTYYIVASDLQGFPLQQAIPLVQMSAGAQLVDCQASATPKKTSKGVRQPNLLRGL